MSTLVVIGGSRGLGASFIDLLNKEYTMVYNFDILEPTKRYKNVKYTYFDLFKNSIEDIKAIIEIADTLILCAGIGTVKPFEAYNKTEIEKVFRVNTISEIEILRYFYPSLISGSNKYCLVMGSIAGEISSPLYSVYGASKAAVNKMCESLNVELEKKGSKNRITCVKPTSLNGTSFNGGHTDLTKLKGVVSSFINSMKDRVTEVFVDETLSMEILLKYQKDKETFGLNSFEYKVSHNRIDLSNKIIVGYLSGTFDLFHVGHLNLIQRAKEKCDYLIVGVHPSGKWKGKETFIPFKERVEILKAIKYVDEVVVAPDEDSDAWEKYNYSKLFVGSDYKGTDRFLRYEKLLKNKSDIIYFDYTKGTSSTQIRELIKQGKEDE